MKKVGIAIHGGAGTILRSSLTHEKEEQYTSALRVALNLGYDILNRWLNEHAREIFYTQR